jgi:hypothetical protein
MRIMIPRRGDIYECPQCLFRFVTIHGADWPDLEAEPLRCCCGETPILLQSGSESATESGINKIIESELRAERQHS